MIAASISARLAATPRHHFVGVRFSFGLGFEAAPEERDDVRRGGVAALHLKKHLQRRFASAAARARHQMPAPLNARRSETISIALTAASQPLLPAFVPARSMACSIVSVVRTPKPIGTPVSAWRCERAFVTDVGDHVEVRRGSTDDRGERDDRVDFFSVGDARSGDGNFPRTGNAHDRDARSVGAVTNERVLRALEQTIDDEMIEAARDDRELRALRTNEVTFDALHHAEPFTKRETEDGGGGAPIDTSAVLPVTSRPKPWRPAILRGLFVRSLSLRAPRS